MGSVLCEVRTQVLYMICVNAGSQNVNTASTSESLRTFMTTIQAMYVYRNNEARSCNHCYSGKAMIITYC